MKMMPMISLAALLVCTAFTSQQVHAEEFAVSGSPLSADECEIISGGETYVDIDKARTVARVVSIPRDTHGMDYSRATSYSVEVHNNYMPKTQKDTKDYYDTRSFPAGRANMTVSAISDSAKRKTYGSSQGEWIKTDACAKVTAYPSTLR